MVLHRGVSFHTGLLGGLDHFGILCGGVVEPESAGKLFKLAIPIGGSVRPSPVGGVFGSACTRERLFVLVVFAVVLIIRAKQAAAGFGSCGLSGYGLGAGNHVQQTVCQRSGSLFHGLILGDIGIVVVVVLAMCGRFGLGDLCQAADAQVKAASPLGSAIFIFAIPDVDAGVAVFRHITIRSQRGLVGVGFINYNLLAPLVFFAQCYNVRLIVCIVRVIFCPISQSIVCIVPCVVFFAVFQRIVGDGASQAVVGTFMGIIVRIRSDPRACIFALILIMTEFAAARAIVHFAFIVRNGVIELCPCVRFILIDKSLSIHVPLELELLVARVQQDRIGGRAIFQKQVGIGSKVKVADIVRIRTRGRMAAVPVMLNAFTGIGFALCNSISFLLFEHGNDLIIAHVFVVDGSLEVGDDRFDLSVLIDVVAVHFDVLTLLETVLKLCDFCFQCILGLLLIGVRNGNCGTGFLDNFCCLDGDGLNGGVIGDVVGHIAVFIAGGAVRIDLDIRIALAFQSCLDLINANAELRGGDCDRDSTIIVAVDVIRAINLFQAAIGFAALLGFGKGEGAIIFGFLPEVPLDLDLSGLTGILRGSRTYLLFGHRPRNRGKVGVGDVLQIFRSRTRCIRKLIGLSVLGFEALQRAIFVKFSLTVKLKTARNTPEVKARSKGGFRLGIVPNDGLVFLGPDHGGASHFGGAGLGVLLGRRSVRLNSGGVFDLFRAADGALFRIDEGVRFAGGIRPLKLTVFCLAQVDVGLRQARASLMIDGLCQCILQGLVLCRHFGIGLGLLRGLFAVFHLLGVGLLAVVVGDGDTQFEHAAQQSVLLVGHAAHFALIGGIAQVAISVHRVSVAGGILVQQVAKLGVIKAVQLRVGLVLCDGIGQVVFLVLIGEGAILVFMGFIQNVLHIKGVILALVVLHSDVGGRIGVILIFLGAEILGFLVLLACHRDVQGGAGGLGGRAGIHLDGGGLLLALRVGELFGQGVGAIAVILVTGFDQLGNIKPGHFAGFNFVFFGQGKFLFAVLYHGVGHSVITELGLGFGIPAQFSAQLLLQGFLHVLRRKSFLRLGTGLTLDRGSSFKRGIGGGGSRGGGRTVRVGGGGGRGGRLAQHKLRVLGLRLGLFSFANRLFLCLAAAVLGAFLLIVQVGLGLLAIALGLLAVPGGLLCAGLALYGHIAVHRAGALGGGGRIVLGDLVVVVVIIHADIRVADHIHSALVMLIGLRIGRHTGSSNGCRSRAFPFRLGRAVGCVIRDGVHIICRIRDQGLGRNTCGQCHRHCSNFKLFIRHDPRSPFLSPCV